jgi:hypothetical protein
LQTSGYTASDSKPGLLRSCASPLGGAERDWGGVLEFRFHIVMRIVVYFFLSP